MRFWVPAVVFLAMITGVAGWVWHNVGKPAMEYRTTAIRRGDVVSSISATGTLEPQEVVDVGAQVAGQIKSFGKDSNGNPVDYRSPVEPGMVLAEIDDTVYKAAVDVAQAQLEQAKTLINKGEADLAEAKSKLLQAEHNWNRARVLGPSDALSQNDYDMYQADFETAKAGVAIADSEIAQAKNGVPLAQAELDAAQRNLDFCTIHSPLKGVILDRRVNVGQTVVSNMSTPSLFLIARDLSHMQIWVSVNEADVGKIVPGAAVTFTTDTFPGKVFNARVGKVRWNPTMTQNVVLYTVEVEVDNTDGVLIPYLTAKVQFDVAHDTNTLIAPDLALRYEPSNIAQVSPDARAAWQQRQSNPPKRTDQQGTIWIKDGPFIRPVDVKLGVTDRTDTGVASDQLKEDAEIVLAEIDPNADPSQRNPFMPPLQHRH